MSIQLKPSFCDSIRQLLVRKKSGDEIVDQYIYIYIYMHAGLPPGIQLQETFTLAPDVPSPASSLNYSTPYRSSFTPRNRRSPYHVRRMVFVYHWGYVYLLRRIVLGPTALTHLQPVLTYLPRNYLTSLALIKSILFFLGSVFL